MSELADSSTLTGVALLAEGVDRNWKRWCFYVCCCLVALLAEGVDRNWKRWCFYVCCCVALLAEGVDRNKAT